MEDIFKLFRLSPLLFLFFFLNAREVCVLLLWGFRAASWVLPVAEHVGQRQLLVIVPVKAQVWHPVCCQHGAACAAVVCSFIEL